MKSLSDSVAFPVILSLILLIPWIGLELINRQGMPEEFPVALFITIWFLQAIFIYFLKPVMKNPVKNNFLLQAVTSLWLRVPVLLFVGVIWSIIIVDQLPCFLGVPNCD